MSEITVFPLFSGSKGNCTLVCGGGKNILIDAGTGKLKTGKKLGLLGLTLSDIDAILITHCHSDHIKYIADIESFSDCPIYCKDGIILKVQAAVNNEKCEVRPVSGTFYIGDMAITPFCLPHDEECLGYKFEIAGETFVYMTDLGYFSDEYYPLVTGAKKVLIEANHDENMLKKGSYPYLLKKRILSENGHLSNKNCAKVCATLYKGGAREFILGHLSEENNCPELAFEAVNNELSALGDDYAIYVTTRNGLEKPI